VTDPNSAQVEYWNAAHRWVDAQTQHDEMLEALGQLAIEALDPRPGERVLDIGCGTGTTTLEIAALVGPEGHAVGADISAPMLARAHERSVPNTTFVNADAQTYPFDEASFDGAFSRFGVMFFSDPTAAFANVRRALRPGGRLAFVCWQTFEAQEWMRVPAEAAGVAIEWSGPNPFAFGDRGVLARHLDGAGFVRVDIDGMRRTILVGGRSDLDTAVQFTLEARVGREIVAARGDEAAPLVRAALEPYVTPDGVAMEAAVWVVRAQHG